MLGVTVFPEYIQSEASNPCWITCLIGPRFRGSPLRDESLPQGEGGKREPPADAEKGLTRLLERPLWGKGSLAKANPSFTPNESFYDGLSYQPSKATDETRDLGPIIAEFIPAAQSRGLKVYFQIQSAIPPGYRVQFGGPIEDDKPLRLTGRSLTKPSTTMVLWPARTF